MKTASFHFLLAGLVPVICPVLTAQAAPSTVPAATQPQATSLAWTHFTLHPAIADEASEKILLLPDALEQTPGDAVELYLMTLRYADYSKEVSVKFHGKALSIEDYLVMPIDQLNLDEVDELLGTVSFDLLDVATHRTEAHWESTWRGKGFAAPLPFINHAERMANRLVIKEHARIARKDWPGAERLLQETFAMAGHLDHEALGGQIGGETHVFATALYMGIRPWIQYPNSPNLYWALTRLPTPLVAASFVQQHEEAEVVETGSQFAAALRGKLPSEQWPDLLKLLVEFTQYGDPSPPGVDLDTRVHRLVESAAPRARKYLLADGIRQPEIDSMKPEEIVGRYFFAEYQRAWPIVMRGWNLPGRQSLIQMERDWKALNDQEPSLDDNPMIQLTLGFTKRGDRMQWSSLRIRSLNLDRQVAVLRIVEAIRDYIARNQGAIPASLARIDHLPVPPDPITGKPFSYSMRGDRTIMLEAEQVEGMPEPIRFQLDIVK